MYYNISDEIREEIKDVLTNSNISNSEKKSIIVDIFAKLFGAEPTPSMPGDMSDNSIEFDPEYAAGYNLGKWFASETYKNYGHEPNTENMIDLPKREKMRILESVGTKLPKDQRLMDIIGNMLTPEEKIKLIIDLFMEPDDSQQSKQGQGQGQGQQQNQSNQNNQQGDSGDGDEQGDDQTGSDSGSTQNQQSGGASGEEGGEDDSQDGQGQGQQGDSGDDQQQSGTGSGSGSTQNQQNQQSGGASGSSAGDTDGQGDDQQQSGGASGDSKDSDDVGDGENEGGAGEDGGDDSENGTGKSAQEELDDLLNTDKDGEANSANNDFDFGDDVMGNDHVISEDEGNKIRNSENAKVADTDKNFAKEGDTSIDLIDDLYDQIKAKLTAEEREFVDKVNNDLKQKVQRAKQGIIDWKKVLRKFMNSQADVYEKGSLRKNLYTMTGIGLHHPRAIKQLNKCVVYIDTSGSVNNEQTQLVPLMLAEIGKIAKDCGFSSVDVNLFHHTVYTDTDDARVIAMTKNIKPSTTLRKDWGILANDGGTDIQKVYASIEKNYTHNGKLNPGIATIIIITDVEGIMDSGTVSNYTKKFDKSVFKKMVYIIYDRYKDIHKGQLTTKVDTVLSPYSKHVEIGLADFKRQIKARFTNESTIDMKQYKNNFLREASLADRRKAREEQKSIAQTGDVEKVADVLRKDAIAGGRLLGAGANDRYFKPIKDIIASIFPTWQESNEEHILSKGELYYITDDMNVKIGCNVGPQNIAQIAELCRALHEFGCKVEELYGNVEFNRDRNFKSFPPYFPDTVYGKLTLKMLRNMISFENAPTHVVEAEVDVNKNIIKEQRMYINTLRKNGAKVRTLSLMGESLSIEREVANRRKLAESYLNEAIAGGVGKMLLPSYRNIGKASSDKAEILDATRQHNKKIFDTVLTKEYAVDWGNLTDKDFNIVDDDQKVRSIIETVLKNSAPEHIKKYNKIVKSILSATDSKTKNDIVKDMGSSYFNSTLYNFYKDRGVEDKESDFKQGLRIFTDANDKITMILLLDKKKKDKRNYDIVCLSHNGKIITDIEKLETFIANRRNTYLNYISRDLEYFHMEQSNVPAVNTPLSYLLCRIASMFVARCMDAQYNGLKWESYRYTDPDVDILSDEITDGESQNIDWAYRILANVWGKSFDEVSRMHRGQTTLMYSPMGRSTDVKYFYQTPTLRAFHDSVKDKTVLPHLFNDRFLRMVVHALDVYNTDVVESMNREDLINVVNSVMSIKLQDTLFCKLMGIDALKENYQFSAITLFADKAYKMIDIVLPYEMVKEKFNEIKLYRDMFAKDITDKQTSGETNVISTYTQKEMVDFLAKNKEQVDNISRITGIINPVDSIEKFVNELAPEYIEDIKEKIKYINKCITNPSLQKKLNTATYALGSDRDKFFENMELARGIYTAITNTCDEYLASKSDADIVRFDMGFLLEWAYENIENIERCLVDITENKNVWRNHSEIERLIDEAINNYTNKFMKGVGSAERVISAIKNRRHKYTPESRRVRRTGKQTSVAQNNTTVVKGANLDDVYNEFVKLLPEFKDVVESVDMSKLSVNTMTKRMFSVGFDDLGEVVNNAIDNADAINNDVYTENVADVVNSIIDAIKSVIMNRSDDDKVVNLCAGGTQSVLALMSKLDSLQVPQANTKQQIA